MVTADESRPRGPGFDTHWGLNLFCNPLLDGCCRITSKVARSRGLPLYVILDASNDMFPALKYNAKSDVGRKKIKQSHKIRNYYSSLCKCNKQLKHQSNIFLNQGKII